VARVRLTWQRERKKGTLQGDNRRIGAERGGPGRARSLQLPWWLMQISRLVLLLYLTAQALDGLFTYVGVHALGVEIERNVILATWMMLVGTAPTLLVAKTLAAAAGIFIYIRGFHGVLATLTALYAVMAIGPWMDIYRNWP
jgi:hypothetical protein